MSVTFRRFPLSCLTHYPTWQYNESTNHCLQCFGMAACPPCASITRREGTIAFVEQARNRIIHPSAAHGEGSGSAAGFTATGFLGASPIVSVPGDLGRRTGRLSPARSIKNVIITQETKTSESAEPGT